MEILITDVTEMSAGMYCVAGWDAANKRMVRPLPDGSHWPEALIAKYKIMPGVVLSATPQGQATGALVHILGENSSMSHEAVEEKLLHLAGHSGDDLLMTASERLSAAYRNRSLRVAYVEPPASLKVQSAKQ